MPSPIDSNFEQKLAVEKEKFHRDLEREKHQSRLKIVLALIAIIPTSIGAFSLGSKQNSGPGDGGNAAQNQEVEGLKAELAKAVAGAQKSQQLEDQVKKLTGENARLSRPPVLKQGRFTSKQIVLDSAATGVAALSGRFIPPVAPTVLEIPVVFPGLPVGARINSPAFNVTNESPGGSGHVQTKSFSIVDNQLYFHVNRDPGGNPIQVHFSIQVDAQWEEPAK
jgi:hypothetical protein